jgi:hypothetical protein
MSFVGDMLRVTVKQDQSCSAAGDARQACMRYKANQQYKTATERSCAARARGTVVQYSGEESEPAPKHESVSRTEIATKLAALKRYDFGGDYDPARHYRGPLYFVPSDTLVGFETARKLGIRDEHDLFGGVVPYPFAATKTITHPLVSTDAFAPQGWSHEFARCVEGAVLFGFSAFTLADLRRAGAVVLERGRARVKPARGIGGRGQNVVTSAADLDAVLDTMDLAELARYGTVIEQNFDKIETYSVGQTHVADLLATYVGTQRLTKDNRSADVYGGSDLTVVRGDYDALLSLDLSQEARLAITNARVYEAAASQAFAGWFASRRNYDVAFVVSDDGRRCCGVLEQSWRIGGASPAELVALEAFRAEPSLHAVRASCIEVYGDKQAPPHALVHFRGVDERVGSLTKYTLVEAYDHSR